MVDIFISYSRTNQDRVRVLAESVRALGYAVWWDDELPPHKSYGDVISEKIASAKAAIVCWSGDAAQSEWVRAEADLARNQKKLIQISFDDVMPPMPFNQIQFASLVDWHGQPEHNGWRKVQASLTELCGNGSEARPTTPSCPSAPPPDPPPTAAHVGPFSSALRSTLIVAALIVLAVAVAGLGYIVLQGRDGPPAVASGGGSQDVDSQGQPEPGDPSPAADSSRFALAATIDDPDGYTNVRSGPGLDHAIVQRINRGEVFATSEQDGSWWQVRTANGAIGYVSRSRIRLLRDGMPPPPAPSPNAGRAGYGLIFPDSDVRLLSAEEIASLSPHELRLARNEIYARRGRRFQRADLRDHFSQFDWYRPVADEVALNRIEQANVAALSAVQRSR